MISSRNPRFSALREFQTARTSRRNEFLASFQRIPAMIFRIFEFWIHAQTAFFVLRATFLAFLAPNLKAPWHEKPSIFELEYPMKFAPRGARCLSSHFFFFAARTTRQWRIRPTKTHTPVWRARPWRGWKNFPLFWSGLDSGVKSFNLLEFPLEKTFLHSDPLKNFKRFSVIEFNWVILNPT